MELDTINKLYLELSQVATAKTSRELRLQTQLDDVDAILWPNGDRPANYEPCRALRLRAMLHLLSANAEVSGRAQGKGNDE